MNYLEFIYTVVLLPMNLRKIYFILGFIFFAAEMHIRTLFQVKMFINTNYSDIYSSNLLEYGIYWKIYTILSQKKSMYTVILIAAY